jgi:hypothetical protein
MSITLPPAARNLFEKRFLDFQKLFIKLKKPSVARRAYRLPAPRGKILSIREHKPVKKLTFFLTKGKNFPAVKIGQIQH